MHKLIEFTSKSWSKEVLVLRYKKARFKVDVNTLSEYNQKQLESYSCRLLKLFVGKSPG